MRKTENIINRTGINKTECKKTGHSKENKIPGVKCTPKIELYLSNFKGALHWWNGSLFFLIIILGITLGIFAGCKNIFVPEPPATPEAAGPGGGITVSLRLFTGSARSVMPGMEALIWEITASQGDITISVANGEYPCFSLSLPVSGTWTFTVRGKNSNNDEIFTGSAEQNIESGSTVSISIPLSPGSGMTAGTGQINLTLKVPDTVETVMYKLDSDSEFTVLALTDSSCILNKADVSADIHTLSLYFLDGNGTTVYMCTETVNVWNGVTSNQWVKTSEADHINGNGEFELTKGIIDNFLKTMGSVVYVNASAVNTPGTGSIYAPVNSVSTAVEILRKANPDGNYSGTIMVSEATTITNEVLVQSRETLTIKGRETGASIENTSGRVFNITGGSLTLEENITLTGTVTGGKGGAVYVNGGNFTMKSGSKITGSSAEYGGGVYVDKGTFTMGGGTISKNIASGTGASGGGVCISGGTFTMSGGAVISKNAATSSGGGVFVSERGDFTMKGGAIGGPEAESANSAENGGGVYIHNGTFTMSGSAVISGNNASGSSSSSSGGGVYVGGDRQVTSTFTMRDRAVISGNSATSSGGGVYVYETGKFTMEGGTIGGSDGASANSSESGGGVCVYKGYFTMSDGSICRNTAIDSGGGVYVDGTSSTFFMHDNGTITNNNANLGGGVYVGDGTFTMNGGIISANNADMTGGGVNLGASTATMTLEDGTISGNTATINGGGVGVSTGNFTMSGGTLSGNTATNGNGGGVFVDGGSSNFTMTGGTIGGTKPNTAVSGGGVYVGTGGFTLGSSSEISPVISGNTKTGSYPNNVYLYTGKTLSITGKLEKTVESGNIGISMATPGVFTSYWINSGLTDSTFFFSDDTERTVALSGSELSLNLVRVEGGNCTLNSTEITLSSFWISPYEVTQEEFKTIMTGNQNGIASNPSRFPDNPAAGEVQERRPADRVRWFEAIVYCNLLSIKEDLTPCYTIKGSTTPADWRGRPDSKSHNNYNDWNSVTCDFEADGYRLPTAAEWEYAARGGKTGITDGTWDNTYSGSDTPESVAWYDSNSDSKTHEVGKKQANALGLYDMSGNLKEWCWNRKSEDVDIRVMGGGYYSSAEGDCKVTAFDSNLPISQGPDQGFRVVRSIR